MPEEWVDRADRMSVLGDPARTHREVKHGLVDTPEEWVDRTDLISTLVYPARATCYP